MEVKSSPIFNQAFNAYQKYQAVRMHFDEKNSYDYIKYNGKTRTSSKLFETNKSFRRFVYLAKNVTELEILDFYLSFISREGKLPWIDMIINDDNITKARQYIGFKKSLSYHYDVELKNLWIEKKSLTDIHKSLMMSNSSEIPEILSLLMAKEISLETICILDVLFEFLEKVDSRLCDSIIYTIRQYQRFMIFDDAQLNTLKTITKTHIKQAKERIKTT